MKKNFLYILAAAVVFAVAFSSCDKDDGKDNPTFTVRFDSKGGTPTPQEQTVKQGAKVNKPADPARENYNFAGWAKADNETSTLWNFDTETVTENMTLFAQWLINTHRVTFDSDGGSAVTVQNVAHGSAATKPADPTRSGYIFDGWFNGETEWNFTTAISAPITLKAKWAVVHTVTFDSDGGSDVTAQDIRNGSKATKPSDPTKTITSGLYRGKIDGNYTFIGWYNGETLWDFNNAVVTAPITLKARWSLAGNAVRIESVLSNDIAASITYVNANSNSGEEYTLLIGTNITVGAQTLNAANAKLTIIGLGEERTITASASLLFTINGNNATSLTLGQNITLKRGRIDVQRGSLTMRDKSKITECNLVSWCPIYVNGLNAIFKMEGGEIIGNRSSYSCVRINSGSFEMNGGSITGNTTTYGNAIEDVNIRNDAIFRLSGNARIGTLILSANNAATHPSVNIGNYSGTVTRLHLHGESAWSASEAAVWWTNVPVIIN